MGRNIIGFDSPKSKRSTWSTNKTRWLRGHRSWDGMTLTLHREPIYNETTKWTKERVSCVKFRYRRIIPGRSVASSDALVKTKSIKKLVKMRCEKIFSLGLNKRLSRETEVWWQPISRSEGKSLSDPANVFAIGHGTKFRLFLNWTEEM